MQSMHSSNTTVSACPAGSIIRVQRTANDAVLLLNMTRALVLRREIGSNGMFIYDLTSTSHSKESCYYFIHESSACLVATPTLSTTLLAQQLLDEYERTF